MRGGYREGGGRPKGNRTATLSVKVLPELLAHLRERSKDGGVPIATMVEDALREFLGREFLA